MIFLECFSKKILYNLNAEIFFVTSNDRIKIKYYLDANVVKIQKIKKVKKFITTLDLLALDLQGSLERWRHHHW